jgi:hypothetical protein
MAVEIFHISGENCSIAPKAGLYGFSTKRNRKGMPQNTFSAG